MIFLCITVVWWLVGAVGYWTAFVLIDPIIRRGDIFPIVLAGLLGPFTWIYAINAYFEWHCANTPVKWLSLRRNK